MAGSIKQPATAVNRGLEINTQSLTDEHFPFFVIDVLISLQKNPFPTIFLVL
jgi:hypothetical protein